jgi:WD40 repeat protein
VTFGSGEADVYEVGGDLIREIPVPGDVLASALSEDGSLLAVVDRGELQIRVLDLASGQTLTVIPPEGVTLSLAFTPDRDAILAGDAAGKVRVYSCDACLPADALLDLARGQATRELTPQERATYVDA